MLINSLEAIGLAELGGAALLDRVDEKFVIAAAALPEFLHECGRGYRVLEVAGRRISRYQTTYFDTSDLLLYHEHASGRLPRRKVRIRAYADSGDVYLEVKRRDNRKRVRKVRLLLRDEDGQTIGVLGSLPAEMVHGLAPESLRPILTTAYSRVTLVAISGAERVTVDTNMMFTAGGAAMLFPGAACIEIKQERHSPSVARTALRRLGHRPVPLSKYCVGVASVVDGAPVNVFKPMLRRLARLQGTTRARVDERGGEITDNG